MDSGREKKIPFRHVVAIPYPGRGHINPMMNLCSLLAPKGEILITFVVTEEWLGFIGSTPKPDNIQFRAIPNVIPSELVRGAAYDGFVEAVCTKMQAPIEQLLDRLEPQVSAIVADTFCPFAVNIGNQRNIPVASLWILSPGVFSILHHFDLFIQNRHYPANLSENGGEVVHYIPGIPSIRLMDLPRSLCTTSRGVSILVREAFSLVLNAQCLILTSFYELETQVIDTLATKLPFPIYPIGPTIPHFTLEDSEASINKSHNDIKHYFKWLNSQPRSSVLYISLGSFHSVSPQQMDEIATGLCRSMVRFLWVAREDASRLEGTCGEAGLVVTWCDQLRVLCHPSIGGFWTHCGWNSVLEGVFAGVPMLTFPVGMDQYYNCKLIVDDWKVGLRVKDFGGEERVVKSEEITNIVQRFMELDGDIECKEIRERARELMELSKRALEKGGSSRKNLDNFVKDFLI